MTSFADLVSQLCPAGVEFKTLGDVGKFTRGNGLQKKDLVDSGVGAIHYGQIFTHYGTSATVTKSCVAPDVAKKLRKAKPGDLVIATTSENDADVCKAVAWLGSDEVAVSGDAYVYSHKLDPRFVSYFFQSSDFQRQKAPHVTGTKVRRVNGTDLATVKIPVPPTAVQERVVAILDKMERLKSELEFELEFELEWRSRQLAFYRAHLLSAPLHSAKSMKLGDAFSLKAGKFIQASKIASIADDEHSVPCFGGGGLRGYVAESNQTGPRALVGRQGALCGNVKWADGDFYATEHAVVATPNEGVDPRWGYHMLVEMNLNQYASKSAQPGLSVKVISDLEILVPPVDEQRRVAAVLDALDELANDISIGLPTEIEGRRKQYEYYRDKLLTFEEKTA
ncbi:restriction endonuclease subunit S [Nocardioides jejuensis]|uniref:Restriction endonuclease subunit S n=1 Tax=Nocardioides jejuensis TaxID=2502782 RepID=A0A4R1CJ17_9ACTN|nr:restriction endonuclease subunit S [Nocardioides jejuensis]TCJ31051.1 restriction endonuclease subunit S [Nocardioides jejuensis]